MLSCGGGCTECPSDVVGSSWGWDEAGIAPFLSSGDPHPSDCVPRRHPHLNYRWDRAACKPMYLVAFSFPFYNFPESEHAIFKIIEYETVIVVFLSDIASFIFSSLRQKMNQTPFHLSQPSPAPKLRWFHTKTSQVEKQPKIPNWQDRRFQTKSN